MKRRRRRRNLKLDRSGPWIASVGLLMVLWCSIATFVYAPWWGVLLALSFLIPQVHLVRKWVTSRPRLTMVVPVVGLAAWALLSFVGAKWWGWGV